MKLAKPVLYTFRRCPYAMRARMALRVSGIETEQREIIFRDKPLQLLAISPKGTVPVLVTPDAHVIDQSLDIMKWALTINDPHNWLNPQTGRLDDMHGLIADSDGPFKHDLDRYKYADRHPDDVPNYHRDRGLGFLARLDTLISQKGQLFGARASLADIAIFPFVRQFANTDRVWFDTLPLPALQAWLEDHLNSVPFTDIMEKQDIWDYQAHLGPASIEQ